MIEKHQLLLRWTSLFVVILVSMCTMPLALAATSEPIVVDNADGNVVRTGVWRASGGADPYESGSEYSVNGSFAWNPSVPSGGEYDVQVYWTTYSNRTTSAVYEVQHADGTANSTISQRDDGARWVSIGRYRFLSGVSQVSVSNPSGTGTLSADAIRLVPSAEVTIVVDNEDNNVERLGSWRLSSGVNPNANNSEYSVNGTFTWNPEVMTAGHYEVQAYWTTYSNRTTSAVYSIQHADGAIDTTISQRDDGARWVTLGRYRFDEGVSPIRVSNPSGTGTLSADAIRLIPTDGPVVPEALTVDNQDDNVARNGSWSRSGASGAYQDHSEYSVAGNFSWFPQVSTAGTYEVQAYWTAWSNRTSEAIYTINNIAQGSASVTVDQKERASSWVTLGTYDFAQGPVEIGLRNGASSGTLSADAIRLVPSNGFKISILDGDHGIVLENYVQLPRRSNGPARLITFTFTGNRNFIGEQSEGKIYELFEDNNGNTSYELFADIGTAIFENTGRNLNNQNFAHGGFRGLAFHPEFQSNGKFYTSVMEDRPATLENHTYLSDVTNPIAADSVLIEWTYNFAENQVDTSSYREVFRVGMPVFDHPIKQIAFDRYAQPGDENYGLLYISHGDASVESATAGGGLNNDALGKVLRINPLPSGGNSYSIPPTNPFVNSSDFMGEIFAYGFRNPHTLSFNRAGQNTFLIVADAGRDNIEEINIVLPGANYGWSLREGTFVHNTEGGGITFGISELPDNDADLGFTYPVAQFKHIGDDGERFVGQAIAGGYLYSDATNAINHFMYADFAVDGKLLYSDYFSLLGNVIQLDPNDSLRDEPNELTQAQVYQYSVYYDHDNNVSTPALLKDSINDIIADDILHDLSNRADIRFGQDQNKTIYIMNKHNGWLYKVQSVISDD